jgi:hypothetical protein
VPEWGWGPTSANRSQPGLGARDSNRQLLGERLQQGLQNKYQRLICVLEVAAIAGEVRVRETPPLGPIEPAHLGGRLCEARGSHALQPGEKIGDCGENGLKIERFEEWAGARCR